MPVHVEPRTTWTNYYEDVTTCKTSLVIVLGGAGNPRTSELNDEITFRAADTPHPRDLARCGQTKLIGLIILVTRWRVAPHTLQSSGTIGWSFVLAVGHWSLWAQASICC
ncbi:MAG: hypothetical protein ACTSPE_07130 [Candidatus Thorarchaeota archaeon]